jgi:GT2 family glycosyltransferase
MGAPMMRATVVIPVLNGMATLPAQLAALEGMVDAASFTVLIADNGSTDGTQDWVWTAAERSPLTIRVVDASARRGVSHARNAGVAAAGTEKVLICDADDVVTPGWGVAMVNALDAYDIVAGRMLEEGINDPLTLAWRRPRERGLSKPLGFLPYAMGANVGLRRGVFEALWGWREDFVAGGDDVDFSWRAQLAGYRLGYCDEAAVHYRHRTDLRSTARQFYRYGYMRPLLFKTYREHGLRRPSPSVVLKSYGWLILHLPDLVQGAARRGNWIRRAAKLWGRVGGQRQADAHR